MPVDFSFLARGITAPQPLSALGEGLTQGITAGLAIQQQRNNNTKLRMDQEAIQRELDKQEDIKGIMADTELSEQDRVNQLFAVGATQEALGVAGIEEAKKTQAIQRKRNEIAEGELEIRTLDTALRNEREINAQGLKAKELEQSRYDASLRFLHSLENDSTKFNFIAKNPDVAEYLRYSTDEAAILAGIAKMGEAKAASEKKAGTIRPVTMEDRTRALEIVNAIDDRVIDEGIFDRGMLDVDSADGVAFLDKIASLKRQYMALGTMDEQSAEVKAYKVALQAVDKNKGTFHPELVAQEEARLMEQSIAQGAITDEMIEELRRNKNDPRYRESFARHFPNVNLDALLAEDPTEEQAAARVAAASKVKDTISESRKQQARSIEEPRPGVGEARAVRGGQRTASIRNRIKRLNSEISRISRRLTRAKTEKERAKIQQSIQKRKDKIKELENRL